MCLFDKLTLGRIGEKPAARNRACGRMGGTERFLGRNESLKSVCAQYMMDFFQILRKDQENDGDKDDLGKYQSCKPLLGRETGDGESVVLHVIDERKSDEKRGGHAEPRDTSGQEKAEQRKRGDEAESKRDQRLAARESISQYLDEKYGKGVKSRAEARPGPFETHHTEDRRRKKGGEGDACDGGAFGHGMQIYENSAISVYK